MKKVIFLLIALLANIIAMAQMVKDTSAKAKAVNNFYTAASLPEKQHIYNELIRAFPEKVNRTSGAYDDLKRILSINYLASGDTVKFNYYASSIADKVMLAGFLNNLASHANTDDSVKLKQIAMASALSFQLGNQFVNEPARYQPEEYTLARWKQQAVLLRNNYAYTYAHVLYRQRKFQSALQIVKPVYLSLKEPDDQLTELYSMLLRLTKQHEAAIKVIETAIARGYQSETITNELKVNYLAVHGDRANADTYINNLIATYRSNFEKRIKGTMISKPAPSFILKDLDGKTVSLSSLKGKIIIVDFWATWCAPCKASFPGMQLAVNKYKDNDRVKFLFIDTWESEKDYVTGVKNYIAESKYTFRVLFDEEDGAGKQNKIA
jgi:thiol-disulfide isomerase/thioredoxin